LKHVPSNKTGTNEVVADGLCFLAADILSLEFKKGGTQVQIFLHTLLCVVHVGEKCVESCVISLVTTHA
jgi:hypothetical protein